jgi:hypothetical protein
MSNRFYSDTFSQADGSRAQAQALATQFLAVQAAFDLLVNELGVLTSYGAITGLQGFPATFVGQALKLARVNASETAIEFISPGTLNYTTTSATTDTLALTHAGGLRSYSASAAVAVTIPTNASVAFPIGAAIILTQYGAGKVTVAGASGVTLRSADALYSTRVQFSEITLIKVASDEWLMGGDRAA